jgi:hypothetical protein
MLENVFKKCVLKGNINSYFVLLKLEEQRLIVSSHYKLGCNVVISADSVLYRDVVFRGDVI